LPPMAAAAAYVRGHAAPGAGMNNPPDLAKS
jgi:hypothetical protein